MGLITLVNKHKNKIFNLVVVIIAIIIAFNIYKKQLEKIDSLKANIVEEEKKNRILDSIERSGARIDSYRRLLAKKETGSSMNDINNIARDSGIRIISIKPAGEDSFSDYIKYNYDLTISALDYDSLAQFVNALEVYRSVYIIDVLEVRAPSYSKDKELTANLRVSSVAMLE